MNFHSSFTAAVLNIFKAFVGAQRKPHFRGIKQSAEEQSLQIVSSGHRLLLVLILAVLSGTVVHLGCQVNALNYHMLENQQSSVLKATTEGNNCHEVKRFPLKFYPVYCGQRGCQCPRQQPCNYTSFKTVIW